MFGEEGSLDMPPAVVRGTQVLVQLANPAHVAVGFEESAEIGARALEVRDEREHVVEGAVFPDVELNADRTLSLARREISSSMASL